MPDSTFTVHLVQGRQLFSVSVLQAEDLQTHFNFQEQIKASATEVNGVGGTLKNYHDKKPMYNLLKHINTAFLKAIFKERTFSRCSTSKQVQAEVDLFTEVGYRLQKNTSCPFAFSYCSQVGKNNACVNRIDIFGFACILDQQSFRFIQKKSALEGILNNEILP